MEFCKAFNARTQGLDTIIPVVITVYKDRSFSFITKTPPASVLIKETLKLGKGSATPNTATVGTLSQAQLEKLPKLNYQTSTATILKLPKRSLLVQLVAWVWQSAIKERTMKKLSKRQKAMREKVELEKQYSLKKPCSSCRK